MNHIYYILKTNNFLAIQMGTKPFALKLSDALNNIFQLESRGPEGDNFNERDGKGIRALEAWEKSPFPGKTTGCYEEISGFSLEGLQGWKL